MAKKAKAWYAWHDASGHGDIYPTWAECEAACKGHPGEKHMGFATKEEAWAFAKPGIPMSAMEPALAASAPAQTDSSPCKACKESTAVRPANTSCLRINPARISHAVPSGKVNRFCEQYGFDHLSEDQRRAVQAVDGKVLLFAVPGSGKTTVLIARVGYMVHSCQIAPGSIVSLTFTKASATEMGKRYQKCFSHDTVLPEFRTIHSFAYSTILPLLRGTGYSIPRNMINAPKPEEKDTGKKKRSYESVIFSEINDGLKQIGKERQEKKVVVLHGRKDREALQTAITGIKNTQMTREQLRGKKIHLNSGQDLPIDRAYGLYIDLCRKYHCMDFDDMLAYALDGLQKHPEILAQLQRQYRYWSIDESQDNSPLQHDLLRLLVGENGNLFMVGDDDQSIYAFRGAKPERFQQFGTEPDVTVLTMGTNYRSASGIVKTAETFIKDNTSHQDKQMQAAQAEPGCIRFIYDLHSVKHQYKKIVASAKACMERGQQLAVLYRDNISALPVMFWLEKNGIPFFTAAKLSELLQSPYVSRILNLLCFSVKQNSFTLCAKVRLDLGIYPSDEVASSWKKACKAEPGRNVLDVLAELDEQDYSSQRGLLAEVSGSAPYDAIQKLMMSLSICPNRQSERMQVSAILSTGMLYGNVPEMISAIEAMKRKLNDTGDEEDDGEVSLPDSECETQKVPGCPVTLTTMHSAKGLEFDHVMIIDFLDPPDIPYDPEQLVFDDPQEPRRLFYVAITRAKKTLDILTVQSYHGSIEAPHPFIRQYASICDHQEHLTEYPSTAPDAANCAVVKVYGKYYGVPVGRVPGVYTSWDEVKAQTEHYSIKPNEQPKSFPSWETAAAYAYPGGIPEEVRPVDISVFRQYIVTNPTLRANWPQDIHPCVTKGILELLHADSLLSLAPAVLSGLQISYRDSHKGAFDYSGSRALAYAVNYLPLNYYKVWTPLWQLLEKKKLPYRVKLLELGAGPGTAGLALLDFYGKLAGANPDLHFSVDYTAVEREPAFIRISDYLMKSLTSALPGNLRVSRKSIHADAFAFMQQLREPTYDLVLESNMLNRDESLNGNDLHVIGEGCARGLSERGHVILIEPGKQEQIPILKEAVSSEKLLPVVGPEITSVDTSSITLVNQCLKTGIRGKAIAEHWYSVIVAERKSS